VRHSSPRRRTWRPSGHPGAVIRRLVSR